MGICAGQVSTAWIRRHRSDWVSAWLTPLQASVLESFFAATDGQQFYLTGGTALAAFHLHHRASVDLDLFTLDDLALREADILLPQLAASMNCRLGAMRRTEHYREVFLEPESGDPLKIDLAARFWSPVRRTRTFRSSYRG